MTPAPLLKDMVAGPSSGAFAVGLWSALTGGLGGSLLTHLYHSRANLGRSPAVDRDRVDSRGNAVPDVDSVEQPEVGGSGSRGFLSSSAAPRPGPDDRDSTSTSTWPSTTSSGDGPPWLAWDDEESVRNAYLAGSLLLHAAIAGCWCWWWCSTGQEPRRRKSIRTRLSVASAAAGQPPAGELRHIRSRVGP